MKYLTYLKEHGIWLAVFMLFLFTIETFLLTIPNSGWLMVYVFVVLIAGYFAATFFEYRKTKKYFEEVQELIENMDKTYLLPEMLSESKNQEQKEMKAIAKAMEYGMNEQVSDYRRRSEEYKEYIETWVHEIKIPIATAKMIYENRKGEPLSTSGIDQEIDRIEGYIEQALYYARSAEVEKDYFIKPIDLTQTVSDVIKQRKKMLIAKRASVDLHDLEPKIEVLSDPKWIGFIIGQIVDNAIKYAKEDALHLEIFCEEIDQKVILRIKDNGIGMKSSEIERVFEKGFTGSNGRTNKASTGIGLYLCKKLCKRLQHDITLDSVLQEGTVVSIIF